MTGCRAWRFGTEYRDPRFAQETAREVYRYYYRLRYPFDVDEWGRPKRLSPLHGRLQDLGAVSGRRTGGSARTSSSRGSRAGAVGRRPAGVRLHETPWFERLRVEHEAFRERAGIIDMTSFGKIEVSGPGALPLLERVADNRIDRR